MGQTSDRFRLILCFGGLLLATVLAAWSASEALSAVGRLLGPLPAIPVLAYAVVGWIGYLLTFKFDTEFVKPLRGIVACWAIGLSLAAMVELFVRIWAIPSGSLRSFERIWLDERDRLNWILRYNLLALALSQG